MHTNCRYELATLGLKIMVLIIFTIIVMLSSHAIGSLQCDVSSRTTPMTGKLAAIQGLKAGGNDGDDQALLDRVQDEKRADEKRKWR